MASRDGAAAGLAPPRLAVLQFVQVAKRFRPPSSWRPRAWRWCPGRLSLS